MNKKVDVTYNDPNDPPFPPKGKFAQWNGNEWQFFDIAMPIPPRPAEVQGAHWEWSGKEWVSVKYPDPVPYTDFELAQRCLRDTAWIAIDGIIDLFKNAAEIKAARAAAIEILKAHKAELSMEVPDFK